MARITHFVGIAALGLSLTGCVTQEKYNALKLDRDRLGESLASAQTEVSTAKAEADAYKRQLQALSDAGTGSDALKNNLVQQNASLQAQLEELNRRYADALNRPAGAGAALPVTLSNELSAFAAQNPDLVDFDAARGIVKFKSDLTFATGDAALTPKAKDVITRFATILNSPAASSYELLVAGHTDNTPVVNPATISKGHKDNWYLSSHRAIAVGSDLIGNRVSAQRVGVVGYADQRPVASNNSDSGKSQNRRVEVLILPTTVRGGAPAAAPTVRKAPAAPARELNKDAASVRSEMSK